MSHEASRKSDLGVGHLRAGWWADKASILWAALFLCVFAGQQGLIWTHPAWADEIQAVLIARESGSLSDFYWNLRYEGHPPLWHIFLKPWLVLGLDELSALRTAASIAAGATTLLVLLASPFPRWLRLVISLNYFLLFEHGVIARSYTLGVFLFFAAVSLRKHRVCWLFIALLPLISVQFAVIAAICCVLLWRDERLWPPGVAMVVLSLLGSVALVLQPQDATYPPGGAGLSFDGVVVSLQNMGRTLLPIRFDGALAAWSGRSVDYQPMWFFAGPLLPLLAYLSLRRTPLAAFAATGFVVFTLALSIASYVLSVRHFGLSLVLVIGLLWWLKKPDQPVSRFAVTALVYMAACGCLAAVETTRNPFSSTKALAEWIDANGERDSLFIPLDNFLGAEIALPVGSTLNLGQACLQTFTVWRGFLLAPDVPGLTRSNTFRVMDDEGLAQALRDAAARAGGRVLLLAGNQFRNSLISPHPGIRTLASFEVGRDSPQSRRIIEALSPPVADSKPFPRCSPRPLTSQ